MILHRIKNLYIVVGIGLVMPFPMFMAYFIDHSGDLHPWYEQVNFPAFWLASKWLDSMLGPSPIDFIIIPGFCLVIQWMLVAFVLIGFKKVYLSLRAKAG